MGKFNNKIEAEFEPPKRWVLSRALSYTNKEIDCEALAAISVKTPGSRITVKKGFSTDLASTPRALWNVIAPWDVARAAIIHDLLYKSIRQYRVNVTKGLGQEDQNIINAAKKAADDVFLMAMKDSEPPVSSWKMQAAYRAVRMFGRWSIIPREDNI
jgi:hypothetical protein